MDGGKEYYTDKTIINQIMLRFRPIAPKPVAGGSLSGDLSTEDKKAKATSGKSKKKYVRIRKNRCKREKIIKKSNKNDDENKAVVTTLQLLPENSKNRNETAAKKIDPAVPIWLTIDKLANSHVAACGWSDRGVTVPPVRIVESWVTVECTMDTCMEGGIGCTNEERIERLESDTCPGFVSDSLNRVKWVNEAYKRMVVGPDSSPSSVAAEVVVGLVVKEELPAKCPVFACRVRVQYVQDKQMNSQTMPCDVWRIDSLGLAWRLDVKAALRLGL